MFSGNLIQYNAPWHNLRHVCVGSTYGPEFYEPVKNFHVRACLQKIADETEEDYQNLITTLTSLGVTVDRCHIDPNTTILDYVDSQGRLDYAHSQSFTLIPRPPIQPRDSVLIVGNQAVLTNTESQWFTDLHICDNTVTSPFIDRDWETM